jgi:hypothetical protein
VFVLPSAKKRRFICLVVYAKFAFFSRGLIVQTFQQVWTLGDVGLADQGCKELVFSPQFLFAQNCVFYGKDGNGRI